jgi:hypothetical protein
MGVPTLEVDYTSATTGRGDHEVHKGHVVELEEKKQYGFMAGLLGSMEMVVNFRSSFARKWAELLRPSVVVLPWKGLKYVSLFQVSPHAT